MKSAIPLCNDQGRSFAWIGTGLNRGMELKLRLLLKVGAHAASSSELQPVLQTDDLSLKELR